jgi:hypothetical protein
MEMSGEVIMRDIEMEGGHWATVHDYICTLMLALPR